MSKSFVEQFKVDFRHCAQLGAARKSAFLRSKPTAPEMNTTTKHSRETWEYPALPSETKEDHAAIRRVRAIQTAERLYAGVLQNPAFRLTAPTPRAKAKAKVNGATAPIPARQTALA